MSPRGKARGCSSPFPWGTSWSPYVTQGDFPPGVLVPFLQEFWSPSSRSSGPLPVLSCPVLSCPVLSCPVLSPLFFPLQFPCKGNKGFRGTPGELLSCPPTSSVVPLGTDRKVGGQESSSPGKGDEQPPGKGDEQPRGRATSSPSPGEGLLQGNYGDGQDESLCSPRGKVQTGKPLSPRGPGLSCRL